ncbi:MAG: DUF4198 domain-containing protein [Robiginitalea sp.]|uniref:DUF4198 domain-containing protein n=1 Tax=Robiginitalea sp. TaxID=1902411 RepID=UPI003C73DF1A
MKKRLLLIGALLLFSSHDMYLKLDSYFLEPNTRAAIQLFNGTFKKSENVITRDRMLDVSLVGNGERRAADESQWSEKDSITILNFTTGAPGTWVAGVSTGPRNIEMSGADFNSYLEHDGILDMLGWRRENKAMDQPAVEKYSKHVKTIFQVGDQTSEDWKTVLGYPIEFVPLENPYDLHPGHTLSVQLLFQGEPLAHELVYVRLDADGSESTSDHTHAEGGEHEHTEASADDHTHTEGTQLRTNAQGIAKVFLPAKGTWYLRTIHLVHSEEEGLTHESNWATLSFAIGEGHSHQHSNSDETAAGEPGDSEDVPGNGQTSFIYGVLTALAILGIGYFVIRQRNRGR